MTYLQQFIQKSIEGGYDIWEFIARRYDYLKEDLARNVDWEDVLITDLDKRDLALLDPDFWKCAGKALGWGRPETEWTKCKGVQCLGFTQRWRTEMFNFIDHLADHKDTEEYFKNILTK